MNSQDIIFLGEIEGNGFGFIPAAEQFANSQSMFSEDTTVQQSLEKYECGQNEASSSGIGTSYYDQSSYNNTINKTAKENPKDEHPSLTQKVEEDNWLSAKNNA